MDVLKTPERQALRKHVARKRALRLAVAWLPDTWEQHNGREVSVKVVEHILSVLNMPPASAATGSAQTIEAASVIRLVKDAVELALAVLPERVFHSRYPGGVGTAVRALVEASRD